MLRILVAIASYGTGNDHYLRRLIAEYRSMPFHIDIVVLSNLEKDFGPEIECLVGLPDRNPWSLPFAHKTLFADRADQYDAFIYSEDDILIEEINIRAFLQITPLLKSDEIAGFLRIEKATEQERKSYPDMHGFFHWDSRSIRVRGGHVLARCTNDHAACYILTKMQLRRAIDSGGFLVGVHEEKYDLLCTAATDPYTQCGMTKLIPVSKIDDFCVHHMSNKYVGKMGIDESEMLAQISAILRIARDSQPQHTLFKTETGLSRAIYSKEYYEPIDHDAIEMIPQTARRVLSVGCGWGATERFLVQRGFHVVAIPLDPIISTSAAAAGVKLVSESGLREIAERLRQETFDCVLYLNVLHICEDPTALLSTLNESLAPEVKIIIRSPNMLSARGLRNLLGDVAFRRLLRQKRLEHGVYLSSVGTMRDWCDRSSMTIDGIVTPLAKSDDGTLGRWAARIGGVLPTYFARLLAPCLLISVENSQMSRPRQLR
jgi:2-polyprenyl-3-methyl-5-hydroxy-6-metoxy-1,4-benzoquinol methylase